MNRFPTSFAVRMLRQGIGGLFLATSLLPTLAQGKPRSEFPAGIHLPKHEQGEAAIATLGNRLPEVAAHYRKSAKQLRSLFRDDPSLWADAEGRLYYACDLHNNHEAEPEHLSLQSIEPTDPAPFPTAEAFQLHSRPGANRVIYLDFDGHTDNTPGYWKNGAAAPPFDTNGDPATFSTSERERIIYIWQRVAEDYSMYEIDVTTQDPGVEALRKSNSSDQAYGIRCVIGGSSSDWYGTGAGGVAFTGSFDVASDVPCWVFPLNLGPNSEKSIAEAASHEVGHTLGLSHDSISGGATYYSGQGNWSPIMGVSYNKPISQWSKGEYTNANNLEDDLAVMLTQGAVYRPDDHGNSTASATALSPDIIPFTTCGIIERASDLDFFRIDASGGPLGITVKPGPRGANLRIELKLYNASGSLLQTATSADTSSNLTGGTQPVIYSGSVAAGAYYFSVDGIGNSDPATTGYSDYASLGQYLITLTGVELGGSTWLRTAGGNYQWDDTSNWLDNSRLNSAGATLRVNNNITGDQSINLNTMATLGNLFLGDSNGSHQFTLASTGGSLIFDNLSAASNLSKTTGADDVISAPVTLTGELTITQSAAGTLALDGAITGTGSLTKEGAGILALAGANTYSGTTTIGNGVLRLDSADSLPGGIDNAVGAGESALSLGGGVLGLANGNFSRQHGAGASQVQWIGHGGFAAFGADRTVSVGTLSWGSSSLVGKTLILGHETADATLVWTSNLSFAGSSRVIQVADGSADVDARISGVLSGGGTFVKAGVGVLEISGVNSYTAATSVNGGVLRIGNSASLPSGNLTLNGGILGLGAGDLTSHTLGTGTNQLQWTGSGGFAAFGMDRAVGFTGSSINWSATFFIGGGRPLILGHPTADATLDWQQPISLAGTARTIQVIKGTATIDAKMSGSIGGGTSGGTNNIFIKTGDGTLAFTAQNYHWGNTIIAEGTLMIGDGGSTGGASSNSPEIIVESSATLAVNRNNTVTQGSGNEIKPVISGDGAFAQIGSGTTILNLTNTYTGGTVIHAGTLEANNDGALGTGVVTMSGGILSNNTSSNLANAIELILDGTVDVGAARTLELSGGISGSGAIVKSGTGTLTLSGTNIYSGNTTVIEGTLALGSVNPNSGTSTVTLSGSGATLDLEFAGADTVDKLFIGTTQMAAGVYEAIGNPGPGIEIPQITGLGMLSVTSGPPIAGYISWQSINGTAQSFGGDHDHDGVANGIEYFLGGPTANTTGFTILPGVVDTSGSLSVTWTRGSDYTGTYGIDFLVETSTILSGAWTPETIGINVVINGNQVKYTFPATNDHFVRLKVTGP